ncbi:MAG: aldo/keto reductase [Phycisphaerales bacterium]|nr:aldo/keto reductase [Phycisphaerales bacterium]
MQTRPLGASDLRLSVLGFGCAPVASRATARESEAAIRAGLDAGITYFDTADMYGLGGSEKTLARVLAGRPDRPVVATKCGYTFSAKLKAVAFLKPILRPLVRRLKGVKAGAASVMASQRSQNFDPAYIRACVDASLARLGFDRIDLFYLHDPPLDVIRRGAALATLRELKAAGKLRHIGLSGEASVAAAALQTPGHGMSAVQVAIGPLNQEAVSSVLPLARAQGVGVVAGQPFSNGRLFSSETFASALRQRGLPTDPRSMASVALRFVRDLDGVTSVLCSMMRPENLRTNAAAADGPALTSAERDAVLSLAGPERR